MTAYHGYLLPLSDKEHVICFSESDKSQKAPGVALELHSARSFVTIVNGIQELAHFSSVVHYVIFKDVEMPWWGSSIDLQHSELLVQHISADEVESGAGFVQG